MRKMIKTRIFIPDAIKNRNTRIILLLVCKKSLFTQPTSGEEFSFTNSISSTLFNGLLYWSITSLYRSIGFSKFSSPWYYYCSKKDWRSIFLPPSMSLLPLIEGTLSEEFDISFLFNKGLLIISSTINF